MSNHTQNNVASTILEQLGGSRFVAMTGATNLLDLGNGLQFKIGRNGSGVTHVSVELDADDFYTVTFQRVHGYDVTPKGISRGVCAADLAHVFATTTGLYTSL